MDKLFKCITWQDLVHIFILAFITGKFHFDSQDSQDEKDKKQLEEILKGSQFGDLIANLNILPPSDTTARETIQEEQDKEMGKKRKKSSKDSKLPSTKKSKKSKEKECNDKSLERVAEELALIELESENVHVLEMPSTSGLDLGLDVTTPVHVHVPTEVGDIETHSTDASSVSSVLAGSFSILDNSELNFSSQSRTEVSRTEERIRNLEHQNYQLSNRVSQLESNFQWLWNSQQQA